MKIIAIDAGHGSKFTGAKGVSATEQDINLAVALALAKILTSKGYKAVMTRAGKSNPVLTSKNNDLYYRPKMAEKAGAEMFISIHCNSAVNKSASGFEVWTTPGQNKSDKLATCIFKSYTKAFPQIKQRTDMTDGDPDKEESFCVIKHFGKGPAVLLELEFISNPTAEKWLISNVQKIAVAIAEGIQTYFTS